MYDREQIPDEYKFDLSHIFKSEEDFEYCYRYVLDLCLKLKDYEEQISDSDSLLGYLNLYNETASYLDMIKNYSAFKLWICQTDEFLFKMVKRAENLAQKFDESTLFFNSEILKYDYDQVLAMINKNDNLEVFGFYLKDIFRRKKYTLSKDKEDELLKELKAIGGTYYDYLALTSPDDLMGTIKDADGNDVLLTYESSDPYFEDSSREVRIDTYRVFYDYLRSNNEKNAECYNRHMERNIYEAKERGYDSVLQMYLFEDDIKEEVFDTLLSSVHKHLPSLQRYFVIKAKALGLEVFQDCDNGLLVGENDVNIPFEDGKRSMFESLKPLGADYIRKLQDLLSHNILDVYPTPSKKEIPCSSNVYLAYPYALINYKNDLYSINAMVHELGHCMNDIYSKKQPFIYADASIIITETAAIVNQILLRHYMYEQANTDEEKITYLEQFLNDFISLVYKNMQKAEFEKITHEMALGGELSAEELNDTYYNLYIDYFGEKMARTSDIKYFWQQNSQLYSSFYTYKYAVGFVAALAITSGLLNDKDGSFKESYLDYLSSGSASYPADIFSKVGIDIYDESLYETAFDIFDKKLNELDTLITERNLAKQGCAYTKS